MLYAMVYFIKILGHSSKGSLVGRLDNLPADLKNFGRVLLLKSSEISKEHLLFFSRDL